MAQTDKTKNGHQQRVAQRKARILEAAARLFAENGFHRTGTKDIAQAADVAEGTIYNYFENKEGLLMHMINSLADLQQRQELFNTAVDQDIQTFFSNHFVERLTQLGDNYNLFLAVLPEIMNTPVLRDRYRSELLEPATKMLEDYLEAQSDKGTVRAMDFALAARFVVSMLLGMQIVMVMGDAYLREAWANPEHIGDELMSLLFRGVRPDAMD